MTATDEQVRAYYDSVPYASFSYMHSSPEHLAAVAYLFGLSTPPVANARVLELGCSSGGNLIPFALRNPDAVALGLDISGAHIFRGEQLIQRAGLRNVNLREANLASIDAASLGQFDYVICHGVYSWVPPHVQDAMLDICRRTLSPEGVVYISYNTYPGWKSKEVIRDAMLLHSRDQASIEDRLAYSRAMIGFLRQVTPKNSLMARVVEENIQILSKTSNEYVAHEYLEPYNLPCYFQQFVSHASRYGLSYVAEAEPSRMMPENYGRDVAEPLSRTFADDQTLLQQYLDFATNCSFRQSLLVHDARRSEIQLRPDRKRLPDLHFAANLPCASGRTRLDGSQQEYGLSGQATIATSHHSVKLAIDALSEKWPGTISRNELISVVAEALPSDRSLPQNTLHAAIDELLEYLIIRGLVRARLSPVRLAATAGPNPRIDEIVRRAISALEKEDCFITNAWHESIELSPLEKRLYPLMDGSLSAQALAQLLADHVAATKSNQPSAPAVDAENRNGTFLLAQLLEGARAEGVLSRPS